MLYCRWRCDNITCINFGASVGIMLMFPSNDFQSVYACTRSCLGRAKCIGVRIRSSMVFEVLYFGFSDHFLVERLIEMSL